MCGGMVIMKCIWGYYIQTIVSSMMTITGAYSTFSSMNSSHFDGSKVALCHIHYIMGSVILFDCFSSTQSFHGKMKSNNDTCPHMHTRLFSHALTLLGGIYAFYHSFVFGLKLHWSLFLKVQLAIHQHWFRKCLGAEWCQAIIWTNADLIHWLIYAALGGDALKCEC